jgi:hypothetical protein
MGKIIKTLGVFSIALLLVIGLSSCRGGRELEGFDGTLQVTNNSASVVLVEIDGTVENAALAAGGQWSIGLLQGPHTVRIRVASDGSNERVYQVDIVALATVAISYP